MHLFTKMIKGLLFLPMLMTVSFTLLAQKKDTTATIKTDSSAVSNADNTTGLKIAGHISDAATGKPLPGINVSISDYSAALSDNQGNFILKVPAYTGTLLISGPGYQYKEVPLKGRKKVDVALHESTFTSVYEEASLPYIQKPQSRIAHSVVSVNTTDNWARSLETPDNYLQGKVSGLNSIRRSGTPGIGAELFLHGFSSLYATNQPLVVVDGMIYDTRSYGNSLIGGHVNNPLGDIDVKDIDNITVIKDGASFYGTKGANGVILITTAHAKELATKIDFSAYGGVNFAPKNIPVMNVDDYRLYLSDLLSSSGMTPAQIHAQPYLNDDPHQPDYYRYHSNTNWQDQVLGNSRSQNYYLKVTGGDDVAKYALSVGYLNNDGITDNTNLKKYSTRFNADLNLSPKLTASANLSFTSNEQVLKDQGNHLSTNPVLLGLIKSPFLPSYEISDEGIASPNLADTDIFNVSNPASAINTIQESNKNYRFFGSVRFNYALSKHSNIESLTGITYDKVRENTFIPRLGITPDTLVNAVAYSRLSSGIERFFSIYNDTHFSYKRSFSGRHNFMGNVGFRFNSSESEQDQAFGYNSPTDDFVSVGNGVSELRQISGDSGKWRWLNTYLALDYNFLNKYFLSVNTAVDGSSRFGKEIYHAGDVLSIGDYKYAFLPSVAASWLVSSENFMATADFIDLLKLRASYGLTGNDDIGNYSARQYYVSQNLLGSEGLVRGNIANPQLQWELSKKANLGIDAALFNERISFSLDVYQNTTSKMLTIESVTTASGFDNVISNNGGMKTKGIDFSLNGRIINGGSLKWDAGITISAYRNKINSLAGNRILTDYGGATILTETGRPASQFYGYKTNGVFTSAAEAAQANYSIRTTNGSLSTFKGGDVRFVDLNNDHIIDEQDRTIIGDPNPDFIGSINTKLSWKRISLDAIFTFSSGNDIYNGTRALLESAALPMNQTQNVINRWRFDGQTTAVPKASYGDPMGNSRFSDRWIEDGSYLRLRTLSLSYNLPVKSDFLKYLTMYITGNNLFTLTRYLGYDPEFSPMGSPLYQGIDTALEPQFRSVQIGLRVGL